MTNREDSYLIQWKKNEMIPRCANWGLYTCLQNIYIYIYIYIYVYVYFAVIENVIEASAILCTSKATDTLKKSLLANNHIDAIGFR